MENKSSTISTILLTLAAILTIVWTLYVHYDDVTISYKHIDSTYYTKWHPPIELKILNPGTYPDNYNIDNRH